MARMVLMLLVWWHALYLAVSWWGVGFRRGNLRWLSGLR